MQHVYRLIEQRTGIVAVVASAPTDEEARREIDHYALQYGQDGPVLVQKRQGKRYKTVYIAAVRKEVGLSDV